MARPKHATRVQHVAVDRAVLNHAECTNTYKSYVGYKPPQLWHKRHAVTDQPCGTHAALSNSANIYSVFTLLLPGSWMPRRVASDTVMYLLLKALFNKSKMKIKADAYTTVTMYSRRPSATSKPFPADYSSWEQRTTSTPPTK